MILTGYLTGLFYAALCLLIAAIAYKLGMPKKFTRKIVHVLVGFEWGILYHFLGAGVHFLLVCIFFLILLIISHKAKLMSMISSDSDNSPGTIYYAAAMTGVALVGCFVPEVMLPFGIGVFCTSFGDGLAGVVGQLVTKPNPSLYGKKTLFGTLANFIVSSAAAFIISTIFSIDLSILQCLAIGLLSAELELVGEGGIDNVSVTWATTALAYGFMYFAEINNYLLSILLTVPIVIFVKLKNALTKSGLIAALVIDLVVSISLGNLGFVTFVLFFGGSVTIDKIKKRAKNKGRNDIEVKGDCRDAMQVLVNGLPATVVAIAYLITGKDIFVIPFAASLAEAFADTAASGIGAFSKHTFDPFRMKKCERGLSGGMSLVGTFASFLASFVIALSMPIWNVDDYGLRGFLIVALSGFAGALIDSLLGSLIQAKYKCTVCGKLTERTEHCSVSTTRVCGIASIDNDVVNLISCSFAAALALVLTILI